MKQTPLFIQVTVLLLVGGIGILMPVHNIPLTVGHAYNEADIKIDPDLKEIVYYGTLAPNSHNAQMWQVKFLSNQEIIIALDENHLLPEVDPKNREALISLGAFIENIVVISPKYNLRARVEIIAERITDQEIALVTFTKNPKEITKQNVIYKEKLIKNRHTIRKPYEHKELYTQDLFAIKSILSQKEIDYLYYFPLSGKEGGYIASAIIASMKKQVASDAKQQEFADYVRFSRREAEAKKDGITLDMMGLSGIKKWFVSTFFDRESIMSDSFRQQTVDTIENQALNCAGYFLICSEDDTVDSLINTGRLLQRFWLTATDQEIAVHPMSSVLEESPWKKEFGAELGIDQHIQMVLRVGYIKNYGEPLSRRRELQLLSK